MLLMVIRMNDIKEGDKVMKKFIFRNSPEIGAVYFAQPEHNKYFVNFVENGSHMCRDNEIEKITELEFEVIKQENDIDG